MALQKSINTEQDFVCPAAYIVAERLEHEKNGPLRINFGIYKDKAARDAGKPVIDRVNIELPLNLESQDNIIAQAYLALKATADFADALDA